MPKRVFQIKASLTDIQPSDRLLRFPSTSSEQQQNYVQGHPRSEDEVTLFLPQSKILISLKEKKKLRQLKYRIRKHVHKSTN